MKVIWPELATVVAGADRLHPRAAGSVDPGAHRPIDRRRVETVEDDFQHRVDAVRQLRLRARTYGRAVRVVGGRDHALVMSRADLAAAADDAAGEWKNHSGHSLDRLHCRFGCRESGIDAASKDQEISAADAFLLDAEALLDEALAFH